MSIPEKERILQERIEKLNAQLDHLTQDRLNLLATISSRQKNQEKIRQIIPPTLIITQRLIFDLLQDLGIFQEDLIENIEDSFKSQFPKFESVFANYMGLIQLRYDIKTSTEQQKKTERELKYNDTAKYLTESANELIKTLFDDTYIKYDEACDSSVNKINNSFRNLIKVLDAFQVKLSEFHDILPENAIECFQQLPDEIQSLEDSLELFKKKIHLLGEPIIYQAFQRLNSIIEAIIAKIKKENADSEENPNFQMEFIQYIEKEYSKLTIINAEMSDNIKEAVYKILDENLPLFNAEMQHFISYITKIIDIFNALKFPNDPTLNSDLMRVELKIEEITSKLSQITKKDQ